MTFRLVVAPLSWGGRGQNTFAAPLAPFLVGLRGRHLDRLPQNEGASRCPGAGPGGPLRSDCRPECDRAFWQPPRSPRRISGDVVGDGVRTPRTFNAHWNATWTVHLRTHVLRPPPPPPLPQHDRTHGQTFGPAQQWYSFLSIRCRSCCSYGTCSHLSCAALTYCVCCSAEAGRAEGRARADPCTNADTRPQVVEQNGRSGRGVRCLTCAVHCGFAFVGHPNRRLHLLRPASAPHQVRRREGLVGLRAGPSAHEQWLELRPHGEGRMENVWFSLGMATRAERFHEAANSPKFCPTDGTPHVHALGRGVATTFRYQRLGGSCRTVRGGFNVIGMFPQLVPR